MGQPGPKPVTVELTGAHRKKLKDCDARLAKYRAALEADTDPAIVGQWCQGMATGEWAPASRAPRGIGCGTSPGPRASTSTGSASGAATPATDRLRSRSSSRCCTHQLAEPLFTCDVPINTGPATRRSTSSTGGGGRHPPARGGQPGDDGHEPSDLRHRRPRPRPRWHPHPCRGRARRHAERGSTRGSQFCFLFGSTTPYTADRLAELYPNRGAL